MTCKGMEMEGWSKTAVKGGDRQVGGAQKNEIGSKKLRTKTASLDALLHSYAVLVKCHS